MLTKTRASARRAWATGSTLEEFELQMRDAIAFHLEGLREAGDPIPEPSELTAIYVDVAA